MNLLIYGPSYRRLRTEIDALPGIVPVLMEDDGTVSDPAARVEAAWANNDVFVSPCVRAFMVAVLKSPALRWVQSGGAGYENPVFTAIVDKGATLTTTHVQATGIADYVLWGVLDHWQRGPERRANQAAGVWTRLPFRDLDASRWLIVGFGTIGQETARRARAFGAYVTGCRRSPGAHPDADAMTTDWRIGLPDADVVVLSLPLTGESARMADAAAFAAMKPGATFVNVGRGGLVDEPALLAALDAGTPGHALLDVFDAEPLPPDSPFWSHPRVTVTAHTSGVGSSAPSRADAVFLANLRRYAAGETLDGIVTAVDVRASV